jgi:hypothetical protein
MAPRARQLAPDHEVVTVLPAKPGLVQHRTRAGDTVEGEHGHEGFTWTTLADPDGNLFCIATHPA